MKSQKTISALCARPSLWLLCLLFAFTNISLADIDIDVNIDPSTGTKSDIFSLTVVLSGQEAKEATPPKFEESQHFTIESTGQSTHHTLINGRFSSTLSYSFNVTPNTSISPGRYTLPQGKTSLDGQEILLKPPVVVIEKTSQITDQQRYGVNFIQVVDNSTPYVGEQVLYSAKIVTATKLLGASLETNVYEGFWTESFGEATEMIRSIGNKKVQIYTIREALFPTRAGELIIPARTLSGRISVPRRGKTNDRWHPFNELVPGFFGSVSAYEQVPKRFVAEPTALMARPLPDSPLNKGQYILVGETSLESRIDQKRVKVGESVTMTITLKSTGNVRPLDVPELSDKDARNYKLYKDKPTLKVNTKDNRIISTKTFTLALVPTRAGTYPLPIFTFVTFHPTEEQYKVLKTKKVMFEVLPGENEIEQIIVSGSRSNQEKQEDALKKTVSILGEDLLPQHVGRKTFEPKKVFPRAFLWSIGFVFALISLSTHLSILRKRRQNANPLLVRARGAQKKALSALLKNKQRIDSLAEIFKTYLGDRFQTTGASLTPEEARKLVAANIGEQAIGEQVKELLSQITRLRYSKEETKQDSLGELVKKTKGLIEEIEKHAKN